MAEKIIKLQKYWNKKVAGKYVGDGSQTDTTVEHLATFFIPHADQKIIVKKIFFGKFYVKRKQFYLFQQTKGNVILHSMLIINLIFQHTNCMKEIISVL